ncbi:MAG: T9SS type A sorting domain-containing protein [Flavipsychrobacter sp.]
MIVKLLDKKHSAVFRKSLFLSMLSLLISMQALAQPTITFTNSSPTVCSGITTAGFTYSATTGAPVDYSIDWDAAAEAQGFNDVANVAFPASPITTTVPGTAAAGTYNGILTARDGGAVTSINYPVSVTVNATSVVTDHGVNRNICAGDNTTFSVVATGGGLTYQWESSINGGVTYNNVVNGGIYSGATSATLTLTAVPASSSSTLFRCVVSGGGCTNTSAARLLVVNVLPSIVSHGVNKTICAGSNTTFDVIASGAGITYQWQSSTNGGTTYNNVVNGGIYSGATTPNLALTAVPATSSSTLFRCVVSGTCPPNAISGARLLVVNELPSITAQPIDKTICLGDNVTFDIIGSGANVTYQWQESINGGATFSNLNNGGIYSGTTSQNLSITAPPIGMNNYQYRCVVSGTCTPSVTSTTRTLTINTAPAITDNGVNKTICAGDNTTFGITATGSALTYQWQSSTDGGTTYNNVNNGGIYSGAATATLSLTAVPATSSSTLFRCVVNGACTPNVTSAARLLVVNELPSIAIQPIDKTICFGASTTFDIIGSGAGITYQWQESTNGGATFSNLANGGVYSGVTSQNLVLTTPPVSMNNNQYRCIVSGTCPPAVTSVARTLTVNALPAVTIHPSNSSVCPGSNTSFSVTATGAGLMYQWQHSIDGGATFTNINNGGIYSNATTATLNITGAPASIHNNQYRCVVSGTCPPSVNSNAATVTVLTVPSVTDNGVNKTICAGDNTTFGITATGSGLTYQWQSSTDGGTTYNNVVNGGIYSGATTATLSLTAVPATSSSTLFRCVVNGTCTPSTMSAARLLVVNELPSITAQPIDKTICLGANTTFDIIGSGANVTYQWQESTNGGATFSNLANGGVYSGVTTQNLVLTTPGVSMNNNQYRCIVSGTCPPAVTSVARTLTINTAPSITDNGVNKTICASDNTTFGITATGTALTYQWQSSIDGGTTYSNVNNGGIYSGATTATLSLTAVPATSSSTLFRCLVNGVCTPNVTSAPRLLVVNELPSISIQPVDKTICFGASTTFDIIGSGAGITYQWQESTNGGATFSNLANGGVYSGVTTQNLVLTTPGVSMSNNQYRCIVSGTCPPAVTSVARTLTVNGLPAITTQPSNSSICPGGNTSFSVTATGAGLTYQWRVSTDGGTTFSDIMNGGIYSGATTATLNITGATVANQGHQYHCVISGTCPPLVTTDNKTLTILAAPVVTDHGVNRTICVSDNTTFGITATGAGLTYQWQSSTDGGNTYNNVVNGGIYSGATTATLSLTAVPATSSSTLFRCVVNGTCTPSTMSAARLLIVQIPPSIAAQPIDKTICLGANTTFDIIGSGANVTYQWQVSTDAGATFNNVSNAGVYSGVTSQSLMLTAPGLTMNGYQYRCIVSGSCAPSVTSVVRTLTINTAPAITTHPANAAICVVGNASFNVVATGTALTYKWEVSIDGGATYNDVINGGLYSGASTATLNLTGASMTEHNYKYRCVIGGTCPPSVTTTEATLTINTLPALTSQTTDKTICEGTNTSFGVTATGSALTYQWQVSTNGGATFNNIANGGIYSNATTATLNLSSVPTSANNNQYRCVISGACTPSVTSAARQLTVNALPTITIQPVNSTICTGNNTSFTTTATGTAISYQWQVSTDAGTTWNNLTNTGIYSGATTNTLSLTNATSTVNQVHYRCVVSGTCTPAAITNTVKLTINANPAIHNHGVNRTICVGDNTVFSVATSGAGLTYQWESSTDGGNTYSNVTNGGIYSGATTSTLALTNPPVTSSSTLFRCVVNGICTTTPIVSGARLLVVNALPAIVTQPVDRVICDGNNTTFDVVATGAGLTFQWQVSNNSGASFSNISNGSIYSGVNTGSLVITGGTTVENGNEYRCIVSGACAPSLTTVSRKLTVHALPVIVAQPQNTSVCNGSNITISCTASGSAISYQWQVDAGAGWVNISNGGGSGTYNNVTSNILSIMNAPAAINGYSFRCVVSSVCAPSVATNAAVLTVDGLPAIADNPSNKVVCAGDNTTFGVNATGAVLSYQWQLDMGSGWNNLNNGGVYSGVTNSTLTITGVTLAMDNYKYRCVVGGKCNPDVNSASATMNVVKKEVSTINITSSNGTILVPGKKVTFYANTTNSGINPKYRWRKNGVDIPGAVFVTYTTSDLALNDKIECLLQADFPCRVNDYDTSNTLEINVPVSINNTVANNFELGLYPNPNNGVFTLKGNFANVNDKAVISVYNNVGQKVYTESVEINRGELNHKIHLDNNLSKGMYIISVQVDGMVYNKRFTITQ